LGSGQINQFAAYEGDQFNIVAMQACCHYVMCYSCYSLVLLCYSCYSLCHVLFLLFIMSCVIVVIHWCYCVIVVIQVHCWITCQSGRKFTFMSGWHRSHFEQQCDVTLTETRKTRMLFIRRLRLRSKRMLLTATFENIIHSDYKVLEHHPWATTIV